MPRTLGRGTFLVSSAVVKTYRNLYAQMCSFENLYRAYRAARKCKRGKEAVAAFEREQERELLQLQAELLGETYTPGPYHSFYIHEPKRRLISAAPFRDRVVHHALVNVIEPIWERRFIFDSYANRVGKGTHRALDRCQEFARRYRYALQCDLKQFFPSIDHAILSGMLARHIADEAALRLCDKIIGSGVGVLSEVYEMVWFPGDDLPAALRPSQIPEAERRGRGLPIGNLTSQFWANVYLNSFDHFVKRELACRAYVRYVDDFILFGDDKLQLHEWRAAITARLSELRLRLHGSRAQVFPVGTGIPFLGFRVYATHRRLKRRKGVGFQRRFKRLVGQLAMGEIDLEQLHASVRSWVNHVRYGDTCGLRRAILGRWALSAG